MNYLEFIGLLDTINDHGITNNQLELYKKYGRVPSKIVELVKSKAVVVASPAKSEEVLACRIINGDSLVELKQLRTDSIDSLVTDPPAGISFMNKEWDKPTDFIKDTTTIYKECLRVLKPGSHGLVWAIPRTSHWTATALEQAGFEIRDVFTHIFGSGFPKSLNIGKHIKEWDGWGTALKPASEHWILVRKPLSEPTVAKNVLKHGTGGLNIDASRIDVVDQDKVVANWNRETCTDMRSGNYGNGIASGVELKTTAPQGRFPANLVLSHNEDCEGECAESCAVKMLDEQSGILKSGKIERHHKLAQNSWKQSSGLTTGLESYGDSGKASRFFYCAKASKRDRGEGNVHPTVKNTKLMEYLIRLITPPGGTVLDPFMGSGSTGVAAKRLGSGFVGIEKEVEYFEIASKRLDNVS